MVLKLHDRPKILSLEEAARNQYRYDPYRSVSRIFARRNYDKIARILKRKTTARQVAAIPTVLLHFPKTDYATLCKEMEKRGVLKELFFCAKMARSLAREFHDVLPSTLEQMAQQYIGDAGSLSAFVPHYKGEFKHFYSVYRRYGNR